MVTRTRLNGRSISALPVLLFYVNVETFRIPLYKREVISPHS